MSESSRKREPVRTIIGLSLSPELALKVKAEAARRKITIKKLFEELWEVYEKQRRTKS